MPTGSFVSAYALLAAKQSDNGAVFNAQLNALIQGAALNLSHMENWEIQTGENWHDDGEYSGPVINSRRQLWSVAGFIGAVVDGVFGLTYDDTPRLGSLIQLCHLTGSLKMPFSIFTDKTFHWDLLHFICGTNQVARHQRLEEHLRPKGTHINYHAFRKRNHPRPNSTRRWSRVSIYKEDAPLQSQTNIPSDTPDPLTTLAILSPHSLKVVNTPLTQPMPVCFWGENYDHVNSLFIEDLTINGGNYATTHGRPHHDNWGEPWTHHPR